VAHKLRKMIICIGPFCIPVVWGLPFFAALFMSLKNYFRHWLYGEAAPVVLPEPSKEGDKVIGVHSNEDWQSALKNNKLVMVDFTASWCGPCKTIAPVFADLSSRFTDIAFLKVDVDELEDVAAGCEVSAMPTFLAMKDGKEVERLVGSNKINLEELVVMLSKLQ
jgi:thioredoxin 1